MMEQTAERYSFQQISQVTGVPVQDLERMRRNQGMIWDPKGYTLEQVKQMTGGCRLRGRREMAGCRSRKALALYNLNPGNQKGVYGAGRVLRIRLRGWAAISQQRRGSVAGGRDHGDGGDDSRTV